MDFFSSHTYIYIFFFYHLRVHIFCPFKVTITKRPPQERNVEISFTSAVIEANASATLEIIWSPKESGSWRDVLQLTDSRRVKYDIPLVMQASDPRKKNLKSRPKVRKPLISTSNTTQSSYPSRNTFPLKKESCPVKQNFQPRSKRSRVDCFLDEPDKENRSRNTERDRFTESTTTKKQRKETFTTSSVTSTIHSGTFRLTPVQFKSESRQAMSETQVLDYNFSTHEDSFLIMQERIETKTLRRETYVTTPKYRQNLIKIDENEEDKDEFDDSLSPRKPLKPKGLSDFSLLMENINFTPTIPVTPEKSCEFSPRGCSTGHKSDISGMIDSVVLTGDSNSTFDISDNKLEQEIVPEEKVCIPFSPTRRKHLTFLKPTRLAQNFELLTPITPAPPRKIEFASSSLLSMDCSNLETPRRFNTSYRDLDSSTAKEVLEADMWVKPQNIFPARRVITEKTPQIKEEKKELPNGGKTFEFNDSKSLLLEISPPKARKHKLSPPKYSRPAEKIKKISPTKNGRIIKNHEPVKRKQQLSKSIRNTSVSIPGVRIANLSLAGITRNKASQPLKNKKETSVKLHDPNDFIMKFCNPDPFAATTTEDPFLSSTLYYDDQWVFLQEVEFKKWLNALMTPPEHLNTDVDTACVDIGKVWQSCRLKEDVVLAESKESISARYHTNTRLNTLRKAACAMFRNSEVTNALSRATVCVEKGILVIRQDRDLHRDIGLQKEILELFLSYNPLWLRIGLEAVFGETIPLQSNNDLIGLTRFLLSRFFSDPFIMKQHSHPTVVGMKLPTFTAHMNKFMLKKFLLVVYFLDYAKTNKLIGHDPCLFYKKAPHKDSRSILLTFSREVLSGIGDVTKVLRSHGYVVTHKQTYLDEFDYAVKDMSSDLRDGVRLCRAMELITGKRDLTCHCRVPAISRLQKVHNVNIALTALLNSGYILTGDIDAKSICDGHREKTLSLLWQIIYKFQAPRFEKAASCIQTWWRSKLWYVRVKNLLKKRRNDAACVIQRAWRCYLAKKKLSQLRVEYEKNLELRNKAARVIQEKWKFHREGIRQKSKYLETKEASLKIQRWWRRIRETKPFVESFRKKRELVILVQRVWRSKKLMEKERAQYRKLREAVSKIQDRRRATLLGRSKREEFEKLKKSVLIIQRRWRAWKLMKKERESYERVLVAARVLQNWWRRVLLLKRNRNDFLLMKYAVKVFEERWIEKKTIGEERKEYLKKRNSAIVIQRTWRRYRETKEEVSRLRVCRKSSIKVQSWWRSVVILRQYRLTRSSCLKIQIWWRSLLLSKACQSEYSKKKNAALVIQKNWRMTRTKRDYWQMKSAVLSIESWYENILISRSVREEFLRKKNSVKKIEDWCLNLKTAKLEREKYLELKKRVVDVQRIWRGKKLSERTQRSYLEMKSSSVKIQSWFRMVVQKQKYENLVKREKAAKVIQGRWRATLAKRNAQTLYKKIREAVLLLQAKWRATKLARVKRSEFLEIKEKVIKIQKDWRCYTARKAFVRKRKAAIEIQNWWRHNISGMKTRAKYLRLRNLTIYLQRRVKRNQLTLKMRGNYLRLRDAAIKIQRRWRAERTGREVRKEFVEYKRVVVLMQSKWRMKVELRRYEKIREAVSKIQSFWRAELLGRKTRMNYLSLKSAALAIQRRWREVRLGNKIRELFVEYRRSVVVFQSSWRMIMAVRKYKKQKMACLLIQSVWTAKIEGRKTRENFLGLKSAALVLQRRFRANKLREVEMEKYSILRKTVVFIQGKWRAKLLARECRKKFVRRKTATVKIQNWWRSVLIMQKCRNDYLKRKNVVVKLQRRYRGNVIATKVRNEYEHLRKTALKVQACWRTVLARRRLKELLIRRKEAVVLIENWWLEVLRMKEIMMERRREMRRIGNAAVKIQAAWRGYKVRQAECARMAELRERTEQAARRAIPAHTLANRLQEAINVFLFSNDLGRLSMCLSSLGKFIFFEKEIRVLSLQKSFILHTIFTKIFIFFRRYNTLITKWLPHSLQSWIGRQNLHDVS